MAFETLKTCPVCKYDQFTTYITCKDYLVSNIDFTIDACKQCGFKFTNPRPNQASIGQYYKSEQYVSHNDESKGLINTLYRIVRQYTLGKKLKLINEVTGKPGNILDIGCGTGSFLATCQNGGWQITGVEPDAEASKIAAERLKARVGDSLSSLPTGVTFDVITMWHVLEHVADLDSTLKQITALLKPTGTLIVAVPNNESLDAKYYTKYWAAYDVPRHLHHFTPSTISKLMARHHFTLVDQKPMIFDAFYIAMLSTRYRDGKTNLLESVWQGIRSNWSASKTGLSSSIIYILKPN